MKQKLTNLFKSSSGPILFWSASMLANILNWFYNIHAGRILSKEDFAILTVFLSLSYLITVPANALSTTVGRFTAYYSGKGEREKHFYFFRQYWWLSWGVGILALLIFILAAGQIGSFFHIPDAYLIYIFSALLIPLFLLSFERGTLLGQMAFVWIGVLLLVESVIKLAVLLLAPNMNVPPLASGVISIPASIVVTWIISLLITRSFHPLPTKVNNKSDKDVTETYRFLSNSFFAGIGIVLIYSIDVLLVKHYFSAFDAGVYATLSLLGKMLYFGAGSLIGILIPLVANAEAKSNSGLKPFLALISVVSLFGVGILFFYIFFPHLVISILLGGKGLEVLPYLTKYSLAIFFLILTTCIASYHMAMKKFFIFNLIILGGIVEGFLIFMFHSSLSQVVDVVFYSLLTLFILSSLVAILGLTYKTLTSNINSFFELFRIDLIKDEKRKLGILILNWRDLKHVFAGGAEVYIHEIAKRFAKKDFDVTIFTSNDENNLKYEMIDGIHIIRRGGFVTVYIWAVLYYILRLRKRTDIIIDCENGIPFFSPLYSFKPVILQVHHFHQDVFFKSLMPPFSWIANFLETFLMPLVYKKSKVVTISPSTANDLVEELGFKVEAIVSTGVDTNLYKPSTKSKTPLVSYVGRLIKYKSVDVLLVAFKKLLNDFPQAKLIIAGDGNHRLVLEDQIKKLEIGKHVEMLGKVTETKKIQILGQSWIMVHPSFQEGWGITCLEANACKTPVLASNVPGLRDAVSEGKSGHLFEYGNTNDLYQKMKDLILDENKRNNMGDSARVWSENFSWDSQAEKYMELIKKNTFINSKKTFSLAKIMSFF